VSGSRASVCCCAVAVSATLVGEDGRCRPGSDRCPCWCQSTDFSSARWRVASLFDLPPSSRTFDHPQRPPARRTARTREAATHDRSDRVSALDTPGQLAPRQAQRERYAINDLTDRIARRSDHAASLTLTRFPVRTLYRPPGRPAGLRRVDMNQQVTSGSCASSLRRSSGSLVTTAA
jgi:hypothetical protein